MLAIRIFAMLPRDEILARYMNAVPHARNMRGFDDPARYYFGVGAQDLNLAEAALLVGMLPEPNNRDPLRNPASAYGGAVAVLRRMRAQGRITADQAGDAELELKRRVFNGHLRRGDQVYARIEYRPYRDLALREAQADGIALPGNYRLIVFIDAEFQQNLLAQICSITGRHQAAGFFMRPSGEVLATAGSCRYTGRWNRATDIERSIGSTGKLFPLIGAHEAMIPLTHLVSTRPLRKPNWPAELSSRCLARSKVRLDFALTYSCNRPWAEMSMELGPKLDDIIKRFDIAPPEIAGAGAARGHQHLAHEADARLCLSPKRRDVATGAFLAGSDRAEGKRHRHSCAQSRAEGHVAGRCGGRASGLARAGAAGNGSGRELRPRAGLRQNGHRVAQHRRSVRRADPGFRR